MKNDNARRLPAPASIVMLLIPTWVYAVICSPPFRRLVEQKPPTPNMHPSPAPRIPHRSLTGVPIAAARHTSRLGSMFKHAPEATPLLRKQGVSITCSTALRRQTRASSLLHTPYVPIVIAPDQAVDTEIVRQAIEIGQVGEEDEQ